MQHILDSIDVWFPSADSYLIFFSWLMYDSSQRHLEIYLKLASYKRESPHVKGTHPKYLVGAHPDKERKIRLNHFALSKPSCFRYYVLIYLLKAHKGRHGSQVTQNLAKCLTYYPYFISIAHFSNMLPISRINWSKRENVGSDMSLIHNGIEKKSRGN